jgi:hypothetical protein
MSTTTEDPTVTLEFPDGTSTGPIAVEDLEKAADRLRSQPRQLSFFVGGATPDKSVIQLSGKLGCRQELAKGAELRIQVIDEAGEVIAEEEALVATVSFTDKRDEDGNVESVTRAHHVKI